MIVPVSDPQLCLPPLLVAGKILPLRASKSIWRPVKGDEMAQNGGLRPSPYSVFLHESCRYPESGRSRRSGPQSRARRPQCPCRHCPCGSGRPISLTACRLPCATCSPRRGSLPPRRRPVEHSRPSTPRCPCPPRTSPPAPANRPPIAAPERPSAAATAARTAPRAIAEAGPGGYDSERDDRIHADPR